MALNGVLLQAFEWNTPSDGKHWVYLNKHATKWSELGISGVWLPPVSKGSGGIYDVGYGIYDAWDLGEFDQKGTIRTKYGTKQQLIKAVHTLKQHHIDIYADVVLNHRMGADEVELFKAIKVDYNNRLHDISSGYDIEGWTKFNFVARNNSYSKFKINFNHISGTDYDAKAHSNGIFRALGENKYWSLEVDTEFGNYDYLMGADMNLSHFDLIQDIFNWINWLEDTLQLSGIRIDAGKHIDRTFTRKLLKILKPNSFVVSEYWKDNRQDLLNYVDAMQGKLSVFDVPLHFNLLRAAQQGRHFDLRTIFDGSLVQVDPVHAVTFVDNHDTQPGQALSSWIPTWFKLHAYSLILLRDQGYPCVFYGDLMGLRPPFKSNPLLHLDKMILLRRHFAWGSQSDYFDHPNTIGWIRHGDSHHPNSGLVVLLSNGEDGWKSMSLGSEWRNTIWYNVLSPLHQSNVTVNTNGVGIFTVGGGQIALYRPSL